MVRLCVLNHLIIESFAYCYIYRKMTIKGIDAFDYITDDDGENGEYSFS